MRLLSKKLLNLRGYYSLIPSVFMLIVIPIVLYAQPLQSVSSSLWSGINYVKVREPYAYCSSEMGLMIFNISNKKQPHLIGSYEIHGANSIAVYGNYAYISSDRDGVYILDISDPYDPSLAGRIFYYGIEISDLFISKNSGDPYLFVAEKYTLCIYDIREQPNYTKVCDYPFSNHTLKRVLVADCYAYLLANNPSSGYYELTILNVSDPSNPSVASTYTEDIDGCDIYVKGDYAYLANQYEYDDGNWYETDYGILILCISDHTNPTRIGLVETGSGPTDVFVKNGYLYFSQGGYFWVYKLDFPAMPQLEGECLGGGVNSGSFALGNYYYGCGDGLNIIDIRDPEFPLPISTTAGVRSDDVIVNGDYAYVIGANGGIGTLNISDPADPVCCREIRTYRHTHFTNGQFVVDKGYLYVADGNKGLKIFSLENPAYPNLVAKYRDAGVYVKSVDISGDYAYVGMINMGVDIVNIAHPQLPKLISNIPLPGDLHIIYSIKVCNDMLYVTAGYYPFVFYIFDVSDPYNVQQMSVFEVSGIPSKLFCVDDIAYLLTSYGKMYFLNVSDPTNPQLLAMMEGFNPLMDIDIQDNIAYIPNRRSGLVRLDVSDPSNPAIIDTFDTYSDCEGVAVAGNYVFLANSISLQILELMDMSTDVENGNDTILPKTFLLSSHPNPFNSTATVEVLIPHSEYIDLSIYNLLGEKVASLHNGYVGGGKYTFRWDAEGFSSGIYFCRLIGKSDRKVKELVLLK